MTQSAARKVGRPIKGRSPRKRREVMVEEHLDRRLEEEAQRQSVSVSDLVNELLRQRYREGAS